MKEKTGSVKKKRRNYPSKTTINLLYKEKDTGKNLFSILAFVVFMALLAVFTKLMVIDQLAEVNRAEAKYHQTEQLLKTYQEANQEYAAVEEEYSHYGSDFLTDEELNRQDRAAMLKVIDDKVKVDSGIVSIQISYNTATLTIEKTTLAEVSTLVAALEESPIVNYVTPSTAARNQNNTRVLSDGRTIRDNSVKAVLLVQFKSLSEATLDLLDSSSSETVGEKLSKDIGAAVSSTVDNAVSEALGGTADALRNRRELAGSE